MSRTSTALKRLGVAALATVTLGAVVPTLTATSAQAAHAGFKLERATSGSTQGAGECVLFSVTATNADGSNAAGTPTVTIRLSEQSNDADTTTDVSFCGTAANQGTTVGSAPTEDAVARFQTARNGNASSATFGVSRLEAGDLLLEAFTDLNNNGVYDDGEPDATPQVIRFGPAAANTNANQASTVTLTPETATATTGTQSETFTAVIRDTNGTPVAGATATVTVSSGTIAGSATNTVVLVSNAQGVITFRTQTPATGSGTQTVTVTLARNGASDTSAVVFAPAATTPPPTNTPNCNATVTVSLDRSTIIATGSALLSVSAPANSQIEVLAYSRPNTQYRVVRGQSNAPVFIDANGNSYQTRVVPPTNTRLFARIVGCPGDPERRSIVLNVRTQISLNVVRNGKQNYTFSGRLLPARPAGLIASLYRVTNDGRQILTAQARANGSTGQYVINRRFTGTGRFGFVVRTGQDLQNAPGTSNVRSLLVF